MTLISSISSANASSSSTKLTDNNLSEETIKKLTALGIDIDSVSSETEAKKLIEEAEAEQDASNEEHSSSGEETLYNEIKNLAEQLGLTVSENENIEDIFDKISAKLDEMKENSYNTNYNVFLAQYEALELEYKNISKGSSSILSAMEMMAMSNKAALGL